MVVAVAAPLSYPRQPRAVKAQPLTIIGAAGRRGQEVAVAVRSARPHAARAYFERIVVSAALPAAEAIPGVAARGAQTTIPWHALPAVGRLTGLTLPRGQAVPSADARVSWDDAVGALEDVLRPGYLDPWATPYQRDGLCFALARYGALLHHPTGSGKTWTAIAWALAVPGPAVIVTRAATRSQYAREVERFSRWSAFPVKPAAEVRKRDRWPSLAAYVEWCATAGQDPIVVVGWESLPDVVDAVLALQPVSVVWDESHKGKSAKRWERVTLPAADDPDYAQAVARVRAAGGVLKPDREYPDETIGLIPLRNVAESASRLARASLRRLATTATPVPDRVRDLWGQLDLLEPGAWGAYRAFALRYCDGKPGLYGGLDDSGESNIEELLERLRYVLHHVSSAEARANLPAKRRQTWYVPASQQVKPTGGWQRALKAAEKSGPSALLEARLAMAASAKRPAIVQRVAEHAENDHKIVVFTARRQDCDDLAAALRKLDGLTVWCGHGGDEQDDRRAMLAAYVAHPGPCVLVGTGEAWGTGIDGLQCTDAAIFALLPYTPGQLDQWEGRFTRLGQDRPVTIYYPIGEGTADEHLASILLDKLPAVERLVGLDGLDGAARVLAGTDDDPDRFAASILDALHAAQEGDDDL